jgi:hypothetical protein
MLNQCQIAKDSNILLRCALLQHPPVLREPYANSGGNLVDSCCGLAHALVQKRPWEERFQFLNAFCRDEPYTLECLSELVLSFRLTLR